MIRPLTAAFAALLLTLTACSRQDTGSAPAPPAPAATAAAGDATPLLGAGLVEGQDYVVIADGKPLDAVPGTIEVVEFFNYACPACNAFNPHFARWKQGLAADVRVVYAPLDFRADFVPYARAYYAAVALGVADRAHEAVYAAIHDTHTLPGEGRPADTAVLAAFYAGYGVDAGRFGDLMQSAEIDAQVARARAYAQASLVQGTPALLVNGRYLVKGRGWDDMLQITGLLVAKARAGG